MNSYMKLSSCLYFLLFLVSQVKETKKKKKMMNRLIYHCEYIRRV